MKRLIRQLFNQNNAIHFLVVIGFALFSVSFFFFIYIFTFYVTQANGNLPVEIFQHVQVEYVTPTGKKVVKFSLSLRTDFG